MDAVGVFVLIRAWDRTERFLFGYGGRTIQCAPALHHFGKHKENRHDMQEGGIVQFSVHDQSASSASSRFKSVVNSWLPWRPLAGGACDRDVIRTRQYHQYRILGATGRHSGRTATNVNTKAQLKNVALDGCRDDYCGGHASSSTSAHGTGFSRFDQTSSLLRRALKSGIVVPAVAGIHKWL